MALPLKTSSKNSQIEFNPSENSSTNYFSKNNINTIFFNYLASNRINSKILNALK